MNHTKEPSHKFTRRKIKYPKEDPIKDLFELYNEDDLAEKMGDEASETSVSPNSPDDSLKDLIEINRKKRRKKTFIVAIILLFIFSIAALGGFLYFSGNKTFEKQTLAMEISAPEKIQIGQTFDYKIAYQNLGQISLLNSRLLVQQPRGFILEKAEPALANHKWLLGNLAAGDKGEIKLTGKIIAPIDEEQKLTATLTFEPSNFNSEFSKETSFSILLEEPEFEIATSFPSNITLGQKLNIKTKIKNKGESAFENIKLNFLYPENFAFQSAQPAPSEDKNLWLITETPGLSESKEITIEGAFPKTLSFNNDAEREQVFTVQILLPSHDDLYSTVKEFQFTVKIIDQAVNTYLIVNGTTENKHIELGNNLAFSIIAKNNGQQDFENVRLKSTINSQPMDILDWNKLKDDFFGKIEKIDNGKQIIWDKTQIPKLANLKAGEEITINFSLPVKQLTEFEAVNLTSLGQTKIEAHSEIVLNNDSGADSNHVVSSQVTLILNTNINVGNKALYYFDDGTPIGSGPLPFKNGETTIIKIFWDISNDLHEVENVSVSAVLPAYVNWPDKKSATTGELKFDPISRKVTWDINRLPESVKEAHANFSLAVTPLAVDKGKIIKLLGNATLSAKDVSTGDLIIKTKNILTSALEQDQNAAIDGLIQ